MAQLKPLPDQVDLVVVPGGFRRGAALISEFLKEQRKKPGYQEAVAALDRTIEQKEREAAEYQERLRQSKTHRAGKRRRMQRVTATK